MNAISKAFSQREAHRQHWLSAAAASARHPFDEPPFFACGTELDSLEARRSLTEIEVERRHKLRMWRADGAIADAGETWGEFLIERRIVKALIFERRAA